MVEESITSKSTSVHDIPHLVFVDSYPLEYISCRETKLAQFLFSVLCPTISK